MKIAYCISAYTDSPHLERLISRLNNDDVCFIIHVDARIKDITVFEESISKYSNAYFTSKRYYVQWGGWNQVRYQEQFLLDALKHQADRIVVMTAQDYPIWPCSKIRQYFIESGNKIWMCGLNLSKLKVPSPMCHKLSVLQIGRDWPINNRQIWRIAVALCERMMKCLPYRRKHYLMIDGTRWDIWQASGYFSVNKLQAQYILDKLKDKKITNYFRYCFVPEELTIPTIIFNSDFAKDASVFPRDSYEGLSTLAALHCFYYNKNIKIYQIEDFDEIVESGKMFCRKVVTDISDSLMDKIDLYRNRDEEYF